LTREASSHKNERPADFELALTRWDSDESWENGHAIQTQLSRSKRLLPNEVHSWLDDVQRLVVTYLDCEVDRLRTSGSEPEWAELRDRLTSSVREAIDAVMQKTAEVLPLRSRFWQRLPGVRPKLPAMPQLPACPPGPIEKRVGLEASDADRQR
jgi:hypothetical protein